MSLTFVETHILLLVRKFENKGLDIKDFMWFILLVSVEILLEYK